MVRGLMAAIPLVGAALPGIVLTAWSALLMLGAAIGSHPLWRVEPLNLSEAAAMRDEATVVQLIASGEDPYARRQVRADLLFNDRVELTPLEAAIAGGRTEIVEIILFSSPRPAPAEWTRLRCLSDLEGARNINDVLDWYRPESATLACDGVTRPWP
jgi:hypothetical protein